MRTHAMVIGAAVLAVTTPAQAAELSVEDERALQVASIATGYAFGAFHTVVIAAALVDGEPLDRSWVVGTVLSSISFVGLAGGYIVLANDVDDVDRGTTYHLSAAPGLVLGGAHLGFAIDGIQRGEGGFWADTPAAIITLLHGASLASMGWVLGFAPNEGSTDLAKIAPIYTWGVSGSLATLYGALSLIFHE